MIYPLKMVVFYPVSPMTPMTKDLNAVDPTLWFRRLKIAKSVRPCHSRFCGKPFLTPSIRSKTELPHLNTPLPHPNKQKKQTTIDDPSVDSLTMDIKLPLKKLWFWPTRISQISLPSHQGLMPSIKGSAIWCQSLTSRIFFVTTIFFFEVTKGGPISRDF